MALVYDHLGTLDDELAFARQQGWVWLPGDLPQIPNSYGDPNVQVSETDLHGDTECDRLECAYCLLKRLGGRPGDGSRHANYFENHLRYFRGDFRPADPALWATGNAWYRGSEQWVTSCTPGVSGIPDHGEGQRVRRLPCHFYVAGLFMAAMETGDTLALAEGLALMTDVEDWYLRRALDGTTSPLVTYDPATCPPAARGMARHWKGACWAFKATRDERWRSLAHRIAGLAFTGFVITPGIWLNLVRGDAHPGFDYGVSSIHHAIFGDALWLTRELTDDLALKQQCDEALIGMATFARDHGLNPATQLAPYQYHLKSSVLPRIEIAYHGVGPDEGILDTGSAYTTSWIHPLVHAARISGDKSFLATAKQFWFNVSHHQTGTPIGSGPDIPATSFGRFMDHKMDLSTSSDLYAKGESALAHEMWRDLMAVPEGPPTLDTFKGWFNVSPLLKPSPRSVCEGWGKVGPVKTLTHPVGRSYSGVTVLTLVIDGKLTVLIFDWGGGDQSHQGTDVELLDTLGLQWTQQYEPEVFFVPLPGGGFDTKGSPGGVTPRGNVYTGHIYQRACVDDKGRVYVACYDGLWRYDVRAKTWTKLTTSMPRASQDLTGHLLVFARGKVLLFSWSIDDQDPTGAGGRHVYQYNDDGDAGQGTFTPLVRMPDSDVPPTWGENYAAVNEKAGHVLIASFRSDQGLTWHRYDLTLKTFTKIDGPAGYGAALAYDTDRELVLVAVTEVAGQTRMYAHDGTRFAEVLGGAPFPTLPPDWYALSRSAPTRFNPFGYDRRRKVFWLVWNRGVGGGGMGGTNEGDVETWAWAWPDGAAIPPSPPPPPPIPPTEATMKALYLGRSKGDILPATPTDGLPISPTPVDNERIRLTELPAGKVIKEIEVKGSPEGLWHSPWNRTNWAIRYVLPPTDVTEALLQFASWEPIRDFTVKVWFADGTSTGSVHAESIVPGPDPVPVPTPTPSPLDARVKALENAVADLQNRLGTAGRALSGTHQEV